MNRLVNENEKLNKENIIISKDISKITEIKENNKNKESMGERIIKLTNQISSLEKQLDESENKISDLKDENDDLKNNEKNREKRRKN